MHTPGRAYHLVKESVRAYGEDYASSMGAAISFYALFSMAPLLLIIIAILGAVFGAAGAEQRVLSTLGDAIGADSAHTVAGVLQNARAQSSSGLMAVIGLGTLLLGATTVLAELQSALDRIWRSKARPTAGGAWSVVRQRVLTFGLILGLVFLLLVSLVVSAALGAVGRWLGGAFVGASRLFSVINNVAGLGVVTLLFALIYKLLPRERIAWRDVWVGALVTAVLFTVGKILIGLYLGHSALASSYGAAASLIVLLLWIYYSAQIFLLGAEFTWVYAYTLGSRADQPPPSEAPKCARLADDRATFGRPLVPRPAM